MMPSLRSLAFSTLVLAGVLLVSSGSAQAQNLFPAFTAATLVDNDSSSSPTPGDAIDYTFQVISTASVASAETTSTHLIIPAIDNTTLVTGSPAPALTSGAAGGAVLTLENGNTSIRVDLPGTVDPGNYLISDGVVTGTFRVLIDDPLPNKADQVNAIVQAFSGPPEAESGTPALKGFGTNVTNLAVPAIGASLEASLLVDGNSNGEADPGDTIEYTAEISEQNGFAADNLVLDIPAVTGGTLQVGTVAQTPSLLTINSGNTGGDTSVNVSTASLPASATVTLTYQVLINASPGVSQLTAQGTLSTDGFSPAILTNDPSGVGDPAPTVTPLADPTLAASMTWALLTDVDSDGLVDPGDAVRYTVVVTESNAVDASGVTFALTPQGNAPLIVGTVSTTQGIVNSGNSGGDTNVAVNLGTVSASGSATITFDVQVSDPLNRPAVVLSNQGTVSASGLTNVLTDDPGVPGTSDPTLTPLSDGVSTTVIEAAMLDTVIAGGDGVTAGGTIRYTVTIVERTGVPAELVVFTLPAITDTTLVTGTVTTTQGTVTTGNSGGDTTISVAVGTLLPNGSATISFDLAVIGSPVGSQISAQGSAAGNNFTTVSTEDDPAGGATLTPIVTAGLDATLDWTVSFDGNGNGGLDNNDVVEFTAVITKNGAADVDTVVFTMPSTTGFFFSGTPTTTQGTLSLTGGSGFDIDVGTMTTASGPVTIVARYQVFGLTPPSISVQGTVSSSLPLISTDDPNTGTVDDPTVIPVGAAPNLTVTLTDAIQIDGNSNGLADAGDRVRYTAVITETNGAAAGSIVFTHPAVAETALVVGNVTTSQGTVDTGNTGGDTTVQVSVGSLTGGSATITFDVDVNGSLTPGVSQLSAQGTVTSADVSTLQSDDPAVGGTTDPTLTQLVNPTATADIVATMTAAPNPVTPAATLTYTVTLTERSGNPSQGTTFTIDAIPDAVLNPGSVSTSQGSVTTGNTAGDTTVNVHVGDLAGSGTATITFATTVGNPPSFQISAQGSVQGTNITTVQTQDPATSGATVTPLAGPILAATLTDVLLVDADSDGGVSPGDSVRYTAVVTNTGSASATTVVFQHPAIANTTLVVGSVTTSAGSVTTGNTAGDTTVEVAVGTLPANSGETITFDVLVDSPFPDGVTELSAQGTASAANAGTADTDDPDALGLGNDPTLTPIDFVQVSLTLVDALVADGNSDGNADPTETLQYTAVFDTTGTRSLTGAVFTLTPDSNTTLVAGSVTTDKGTVGTGNTAGDSTVTVNIGGQAPSDPAVTIQFLTLINAGLAAGVTEVSQQGSLVVTGLPTTLSDDPAAAGATDPTTTAIIRPIVSATLVDALQVDADSDGGIGPGDTVRYTAVITNSGNSSATNVVFTHPAVTNTALVNGSVTSTAGTIDTGNGGGPDTTVQVTIPTLANGSSETITFDVLVDDPLPGALTQLSAQGSVSADDAATVSTDDPADPGLGTDPTLSALDYVRVSLTLVDSLSIDGNTDGNADPGDTLLYTAVLDTTGTRNLTTAAFTLSPEANTTLVVGSVTTDQGSVTTGNTGGDTTVAVNIGTVTPAGTVTITFQTLVNAGIGPGVQQVSQQGTLTAAGLSPILSDDPAFPGATDPTPTTLPRPTLSGTLAVLLQADLDTDTVVDPGDTLRYTAVISNAGLQAGDTVVFTVAPDANTLLVVGSVTTSVGAVTTGNTAGDTTVSVAVGALAATSSVTITFDAVVRFPFPKNTVQVSNQGTVTSNTFPTFLTDDVTQPGAADPTDSAVTTLVAPTATLTDALFTDVDLDGIFDPGDSLLYTAVVTGGGDTVADAVILTLAPDANTVLDVGTVTTTLGTVTTGNTAGDTTIAVAIGDLAPGTSATITFRVTANLIIPPGTTQVAAQGIGTGGNFGPFVTDDPDTVAADATVTMMLLSPRVRPTLAAFLTGDLAKPLRYTLNVTNNGNVKATGTTFSVVPDPASVLIAGSVTANLGAVVTTGNAPGDTTVLVTLGDLAVGQVLQVVYFVDSVDPTPNGVQGVSEQGVVKGTNIPDTVTDDPSTAAIGDPTVTTRDEIVLAFFGPYIAANSDGGGLCQASPGGGGGAWPWLLPLWWAWRRRYRSAPVA